MTLRGTEIPGIRRRAIIHGRVVNAAQPTNTTSFAGLEIIWLKS
jgi:hypothetical protein